MTKMSDTSDDLLRLADVTLAVLAGGAGSRMGAPKGELRLRGRPILEHLLDRFNWPGPTLLVTAPGREHPPAWQRFDREVVDPVADQGPLRGVLTALESASTEIVLITTVDMPGVTLQGLRWLATRLAGRAGTLGLMTRCRPDHPIEPFPSAYRRQALQLIAHRLVVNRSVQAVSEEPSIEVVAAPAEWPRSFWTNLNTPLDVHAYSL